MLHSEEFFSSRKLASDAAAKQIETAIESGLDHDSKALIIVSGGSTPEQCYTRLASRPLDWEKVHVLPSDERCVPSDHPASNENMIRRTLITHKASAANLVSIYNRELALTDQCTALGTKLDSLPGTFATALLGMGEDGHFASLFADNQHLDEVLDPDSQQPCMLINTPASTHHRMTLTLSTILRSKEIILLFFGNAKHHIYEQSKLGQTQYPLSALLQQQRVPVRVYWAE